MKGFENHSYLLAYIISNSLALLFLLISARWPKAGRPIFSLLFAWAGWINWRTAINSPQHYLDYSDLAIPIYQQIIRGWFSRHITLVVGLIASCQLLIAGSLLLKGRIYKIAVIGAVVFLLAIMPLGVGSGFPCTLILAVTLYFYLFNHSGNYIWKDGSDYKGQKGFQQVKPEV
jgi:hypothetical protein